MEQKAKLEEFTKPMPDQRLFNDSRGRLPIGIKKEDGLKIAPRLNKTAPMVP